MFAGKKSAQIREILISESTWEEMTCLFAPSLIEDILFIKESDFIHHFEHLLQITRSAIFSFAFMVRQEGMKEKKEGIHYMTRELHAINYSAD
ncbi:hypothetical protein ACBQ65_12335 [Escherichia coli]